MEWTDADRRYPYRDYEDDFMQECLEKELKALEIGEILYKFKPDTKIELRLDGKWTISEYTGVDFGTFDDPLSALRTLSKYQTEG